VKRKIVFASHDPGGFNLLFPIIQSFADHIGLEVHLLLVGSSLTRFNAFDDKGKSQLYHLDSFSIDGFPNELDVNKADVWDLLDKINPDAIITGTSINSNVERYCISYGYERNVPALAIIDSWVGENVRFKSRLIEAYPRIIMVTDESMADRYRVFGNKGSEIVLVGNPHLEELYNRNLNRIAKQKVNLSRVLFFSENISHYYPDNLINEYTILGSILEYCNLPEPLTLAIRPHPLESHDNWRAFISDNSSKNSSIRLEIDGINSVEESILTSKLTFGISSMALIESSIFLKPTFSYQVGMERENSMLYIPFEEFGILRLTNMNEVRSMFSISEKPISSHPKKQTISSIAKIQGVLRKLGVEIE